MSIESKEQKKPVLACNMTALNVLERARHKQLREEMGAKIKGMREMKDGYEFSLTDDAATIKVVAEWMTLERLCCPFFTFQLEVEGPGRPLLLRLTGPEGVKQFMQSELGLK